MIYVKKYVLQSVLFVLFLSCISNCTTSKNLTTYSTFEFETKGRRKNPALLYFADDNLESNDSIIKHLTKKYYVIKVVDTNEDILNKLNGDNSLTRGLQGLEIYNHISNQINLKGIVGSGLECLHVYTWAMNTRTDEIHLFPLFEGSLNDHLRLALGGSTTVFPAYNEDLDALEIYENINSQFPVSGMIQGYSYRYLESLKDVAPHVYMRSYEGKLEFNLLR